MLDIKDKVILSLDQSSNLTGYSVYKNEEFLSYGILSLKDITSKSHGELYYDEKVENVKQFLIRCIDYFKPDIVVIEDIQRQSNVRTFKDLAYLHGVLKNYLYENNIPFVSISPSAWRGELKIKGRKRVDVKKNTQSYVKDNFGIEVTEDEADAICIGIATSKMLSKGKIELLKE